VTLRLASATIIVVAAAVLAAASAGTVSAACRTTRANDHVPAGASSSLFGNGLLATAAYGVIYATSRTLNRDGTISEKFPWFAASGLVGDLRITGKRLDRAAPPLRARINPGSVESAPDVRFWASGITFPTVGCWRVTGRVGDVRLSLVVLVRR
jgi:hypothetical protein